MPLHMIYLFFCRNICFIAFQNRSGLFTDLIKSDCSCWFFTFQTRTLTLFLWVLNASKSVFNSDLRNLSWRALWWFISVISSCVNHGDCLPFKVWVYRSVMNGACRCVFLAFLLLTTRQYSGFDRNKPCSSLRFADRYISELGCNLYIFSG